MFVTLCFHYGYALNVHFIHVVCLIDNDFTPYLAAVTFHRYFFFPFSFFVASPPPLPSLLSFFPVEFALWIFYWIFRPLFQKET